MIMSWFRDFASNENDSIEASLCAADTWHQQRQQNAQESEILKIFTNNHYLSSPKT